MDELVQQISSTTDVDPAAARTAIAIILKFLLSESDADGIKELVTSMPGATEAIDDAPAMVGGGIMGAFISLKAAGLGIGQIHGVASELLSYANTKVGDDEINRILSSVPGLNQFV